MVGAGQHELAHAPPRFTKESDRPADRYRRAHSITPALTIEAARPRVDNGGADADERIWSEGDPAAVAMALEKGERVGVGPPGSHDRGRADSRQRDRKSTRLNSSHIPLS